MLANNETLQEHPSHSMSVNVTHLEQLLTTLRALTAPFEINMSRTFPQVDLNRNFKVMAEYSTKNRMVKFDFFIEESHIKLVKPCTLNPGKVCAIDKKLSETHN